MSKLTQKLLKELFIYRTDGKLIRIKKTAYMVNIGDVAGYTHKPTGRAKVKIKGKSYFIHRLVFLFHKGFLPAMIDHISGDCTDDRIENLQEITPSHNQMKQRRYINNISGVAGVCWHSRDKKWQARIDKDGQRINLGTFKTFEEAKQTRIEAERVYFKGYIPVDRV